MNVSGGVGRGGGGEVGGVVGVVGLYVGLMVVRVMLIDNFGIVILTNIPIITK